MSENDEWVTVDGVRYEPRHKVIEECARAMEGYYGFSPDERRIAADAIRALKDKA